MHDWVKYCGGGGGGGGTNGMLERCRGNFLQRHQNYFCTNSKKYHACISNFSQAKIKLTAKTCKYQLGWFRFDWQDHSLLYCAALICTEMLLKCCFSTSFGSYSIAAVVSAHLLQLSSFDGTQYVPTFLFKLIHFHWLSVGFSVCLFLHI